MPPKDHSFSATFLAVFLFHAVAVAALLFFLGAKWRSGGSTAPAGGGSPGESVLHQVNLNDLPSSPTPPRSAPAVKNGDDPESKIALAQPKRPPAETKPSPLPTSPTESKPSIAPPAPAPKVVEKPKPLPQKEKPETLSQAEPKLPERKPVAKPTEQKKPEPAVAQLPKPKPQVQPKPKPQAQPTPTAPVTKPKKPPPKPRPKEIIPNIPPPPPAIDFEDESPPRPSTRPPMEPPRPVVPAEPVPSDRPVVPAKPADDERPVVSPDVVPEERPSFPGPFGGPPDERPTRPGPWPRPGGPGNLGGPEGPGGGEGFGLEQGPDMDSYKARISSIIERRWQEPKGLEAPGLPKVQITINRGGVITFSRLAKSSGNGEIDRSAIDAAAIGSRLPPLPPDYDGPSYDLIVNFEF